jgi:hypothetical protein
VGYRLLGDFISGDLSMNNPVSSIDSIIGIISYSFFTCHIHGEFDLDKGEGFKYGWSGVDCIFTTVSHTKINSAEFRRG